MTSTASPRSGVDTTALLVLLWLGWVLVPPGLFLASVAQVPWFSGEPPTVAEQAAANRYVMAAVLVAIVIPTAGLLVGWRTSRRRNAVAFGVALAIGLVLAVPMLASMPEAQPTPDAPARHVCQEHSGGDTRCPGD